MGNLCFLFKTFINSVQLSTFFGHLPIHTYMPKTLFFSVSFGVMIKAKKYFILVYNCVDCVKLYIWYYSIFEVTMYIIYSIYFADVIEVRVVLDEDTNIEVGGNLILICTTKGRYNPDVLEYAWVFRSQFSASYSFVDATAGETLVVTNLTAMDAGVYSCLVTPSNITYFKSRNNVAIQLECKSYVVCSEIARAVWVDLGANLKEA